VNPLETARDWYEAAVAAGVPEPEAMALATATAAGAPSVRYVLLRGIDERGIRFYTNYESRKGRELAENPRAAATLYWRAQHRAIRLEGAVERLSAEESDAYFAQRARGSQIGAWASAQSRPIAGRKWLDERLLDAEARFEDSDVPRPAFWGGFRLVPEAVEFWEGRVNRLHDRQRFERAPDGGWRCERLSP
jgi:pyridoxamine 5'-phosphate oxidase